MTTFIAHWLHSKSRTLAAALPFVAQLGVAVLAATGGVRGAEPPSNDPFAALASEYRDRVHALSKKYCLDCHATAESAGELDLERFATLADVRQDTNTWIKAAEMLDNGEMPPKDAEQPTREERKQLRDWIARYLHAEALANAGDPGPVVLRRLNNAEYTYTVRDLTGVPLEPAKEFPADSAAGEGFANTGNSLVMSPALLTKYLDAGKSIAEHAELLPDGFRFSPYSTRSDWTNEILARIRELYARHSEESAGAQLNVQEVTIEAHGGGRLPIQKYVAAALAERDALRAGSKTVAAIAGEQQLNARYLGLLWERLEAPPAGAPSVLLDAIRARWRSASPGDAQAIADDIARWQKVLWRFNVIGQHIEQDGTNKQWQEGLTPLTSRQEVRVPLAVQPDGKDVSVYLVAGDAGDGHEDEVVVWHEPRLVASGRPDLPLRDVRDFAREMTARRTQLLAATARALAAADEAMKSTGALDVGALAARHGLDVAELAPWLEYLGIGANPATTINLFTHKQESVSGYDFVKGWGPPETPNLVASSSDNPVRIPGNMQPHGVCVHPSPTLFAVVGWKSPIRGTFTISGSVAHAHPECGNGVTWLLELRRGSTRQKLGEGISHGGAPVPLGPIADLAIQPGDLVALLIGPREGNHSCDLTDVRLVLKSDGPEAREWALRDVTEDILAGNPHADRFGHPEVWYFGTEPVSGSDARTVVPAGSLLARWQAAPSGPEREKLAAELQARLTVGPPAEADAQQPDAILYRQLHSLGGPLLARSWPQVAAALKANPIPGGGPEDVIGLDPAAFGKLPHGTSIGASDLAVSTPTIREVRIPAELAQGAELVTAATLAPQPAGAGSAQAKVVTSQPASLSLEPGVPVLVNDNIPARAALEQAFAEFRELFPIALCYTKIVPVDEVVTLTLFHREDEPLRRLMLSPDETRQLNRLWDELYFVSQVPLKQVNAYEQIVEFATQDRPDLAEPFARLREPILRAAQEFQQALVAAEPAQVEAIVEFAAQAYRRPLIGDEAAELRGLYQKLRRQELPHEEALRFTLARVFVAPAFLYRLEKAPSGSAPAAVTDWELASRLSYFLWSSQPD
ncbi:MAG: DUF1587 domain-containing protein, partial [Planctomycetaceae bacterium]|nr:DUF1587 domain-containing protein [Planctomycetaceae bacterium]